MEREREKVCTKYQKYQERSIKSRLGNKPEEETEKIQKNYSTQGEREKERKDKEGKKRLFLTT